MKFARPLGYGLVFLLLLFLDRITKHIVMNSLTSYEINSFFSLYFVQNTGISWGIADGYGQYSQYIIMIIVMIMIFFIAQQTVRKYFLYKNIIPELLVCTGAISNLYDRVFYGGVIDFLCFQFGSWQFPIFNGADIMIVWGIGLIVLNEIWFHE